VIVVATSVISAGYYLQVVRVMFMQPRPEGAAEPAPLGPYTRAVLVTTAAVILLFGIYPTPLARWSASGAMELIRAVPTFSHAAPTAGQP
jgi:NADH-quinone oxidoreductase subunit N